MRFKAIICDLDNTLYDENILLQAVCSHFCEKYAINTALATNITDSHFRLHSKDIFGDWLKGFDFYTPSRQEELFSLYASMPTALSLYEDAKAFLEAMQEGGIKVGILTNGNIQAQTHKIALLQLEAFPIEYARILGKEYEKPHISAFERILDKLQLTAKDCAFVGDNPLTDIAGANNAGIYSIWLKRGYNRLLPCSYAKAEITHFSQLHQLMEVI